MSSVSVSILSCSRFTLFFAMPYIRHIFKVAGQVLCKYARHEIVNILISDVLVECSCVDTKFCKLDSLNNVEFWIHSAAVCFSWFWRMQELWCKCFQSTELRLEGDMKLWLFIEQRIFTMNTSERCMAVFNWHSTVMGTTHSDGLQKGITHGWGENDVSTHYRNIKGRQMSSPLPFQMRGEMSRWVQDTLGSARPCQTIFAPSNEASTWCQVIALWMLIFLCLSICSLLVNLPSILQHMNKIMLGVQWSFRLWCATMPRTHWWPSADTAFQSYSFALIVIPTICWQEVNV